MFEHIELSETIYEGVVEHYYLKNYRSDFNHDIHRRKIRVVDSLSKTHYNVVSHTSKLNKMYVDHMRGILKLTCKIYGPGY